MKWPDYCTEMGLQNVETGLQRSQQDAMLYNRPEQPLSGQDESTMGTEMAAKRCLKHTELTKQRAKNNNGYTDCHLASKTQTEPTGLAQAYTQALETVPSQAPELGTLLWLA